MNKLYSEFLNPKAEYRGKPFWAWNGKLEKEELIRQVHVMKKMGFGGFFMHSRTGLQTEYLGDEWFELINACADEAEKLDMEAWLYDEDRWPSGIAGGMVTKDPEYRMRYIKLQVFKANEFQWDRDILAAFSCRLEGINFYDSKRIFESTLLKTYDERDILVFKVMELAKHSSYNGYTYIDTLNRKATERFIELTHEKYRQKCGERCGKSIKGIFTDEPHRGTLMDVFSAGNGEDYWRAPWTYALPAEFEKKYGYDIIQRLPELFLRLDGEPISQVKWHFVELVMQMFLESFLKPINEWCKKNNLVFTGHMLHEDSLTAQTAMNGSVMRCYEYMDYPGVDVLSEGNRNYWIVKQLASTARQLGRKWMLSELYGATGWQTDFESYKAIGDWQALLGINLRCHHLSWYTMEGEAKRDYPASILHQSTWWEEHSQVEDYFSRIGLVMTQGKPNCEVLVVSPVESVWCQVYPGWAYMLGAKSEEIKSLELKYGDLFHWLSGAHIDFDYGDEDIIQRHHSIIQGDTGNPILKIGEAEYKIVIISGMTTIRLSTIKILNEFISQGGKVIFAGDVPAYVDALKSEEAGTLSKKAVYTNFEKQELLQAVTENLDNVIEITNQDGINIEHIYCQMRLEDEKMYIMLLNTNREKPYRNARVKVKADGFMEEWCCTTGERYLIAESDNNGYFVIHADIEAGGEHIYVIVPEKEQGIRSKPICKTRAVYKLKGPYEYELDSQNVCVLDMAVYKLDDGEWQEEKEILKIDRDIRNKLGLEYRGGEMLQPWFTKNSEDCPLAKLSLQFFFTVRDIPEGPVQLAIENPEHFGIKINGHGIDSSSSSGWWIDKCLVKLSVPSEYLQEGKNTIELITDFNHGINLEAMYLLGQFGVQCEGSRKILVDLPDRISASDLTAQGFPFYSGKVRYRLKFDKMPKSEERMFITLDKFEAACVKVILKERAERIISWKPYEADITDGFFSNNEIILEVVLTRRNTFGPLHLFPVISPVYGPEHFITEGEEFSDSYMLIQSGLLSEPSVRIKCDIV